MGSGGGAIAPILGIVASVIAPELAPAIFGSAGLFGSTALATALTGAGLGAGSSLITGGKPLQGALSGAVGGGLSGGGLGEISSALGGSGDVGTDLGDITGIHGGGSIGRALSGIFGNGDSGSTIPATSADGTLTSSGALTNAGAPSPLGSTSGTSFSGLTGGSSAPVAVGGGVSSYAPSAGGNTTSNGLFSGDPLLGGGNPTTVAGSAYASAAPALPSVGNNIFSGDTLLAGTTPTIGGLPAAATSSPFSTGSLLRDASTIGGAINSSNAASSAQDALVNAQKQSQAELQPFLQTGTGANGKLASLLGVGGDPTASGYGSLTTPFTPGSLASDPGYQFDLQQGTQALQNSQAAKGGLLSGAAQKELADYSTGLADTTYNQAFNRKLQQNQATYGDLTGASGSGQTAANTLSGINNNTGLARANNATTQANIGNSAVSSLLSGSGAQTIIGYKTDGTPIYAGGNGAGNTLSKLLGLG